jgi:predicted permease
LGSVIEARVGRRVPGGAEALHLDGSVILGVVAVGALVAFGLGAVSLAMASRGSLGRGMEGGGRGGAEPAGAGRVRAALVTTQVTLCVVLLAGGALLVRSALHLQGMQLGFDPDRLEAYTVGLTTEAAADPVRRAAFFQAMLRRTSELPGVASAALLRAAPFNGALLSRRVEVEGRHAAGPLPEVVPQIASVGAFAALDVPGLEGRVFTVEDEAGTTPVTVVSASLAAAVAPDGTALGGRIRFTAWTMPDMEEEPGPWMTVVGVVPDVADGIGGARPTLYVPYAQAPSAWMDLLVRRRPGSPHPAEEVRAIVRDLDENTPLYEETDVAVAVHGARAPSRFFAALLGGFSLFSLALALVGLYGVAAYAGRQRRRDLAVRIALGASRGSVEWLFVRGSALTIVAGLTAGLLGARALGAALRGQLHGVDAHDPAMLLAVAAAVAVTAVLAVWIPARAAARLEVSTILRDE